MALLGNIVWFLFGGFFSCIGYLIGGLGLCLTVVGIPFGIQSIKLGIAVLAPFGKEVVEREHANSPLRVIFKCAPCPTRRPWVGYCAGIVTSGNVSTLPVSASVKKNITAVSARLVCQSLSSIQNHCPRYCTAA